MTTSKKYSQHSTDFSDIASNNGKSTVIGTSENTQEKMEWKMYFWRKEILKYSPILILTYSPFVLEKIDYNICPCSLKQYFSFYSWVFSCNFLFSQSIVQLNSFSLTDCPACIPIATIWRIYLWLSEGAGSPVRNIISPHAMLIRKSKAHGSWKPEMW